MGQAKQAEKVEAIRTSPFEQRITTHIWREKYRHADEASPQESFLRVAAGVYEKDENTVARKDAEKALVAREWLPGGRILAGAGTNKRVTWINCFVSPTIQDSMDTELLEDHDEKVAGFKARLYDNTAIGIMPALNVAAFTQQQGGGIGMNFSTIRPDGAIVGRTGSVSSGTLPFMDMWHAMCSTIKSSGSRRGAMMGVLSIGHPDVIDFITAKQKKGRLTNFNVSVLVHDDFMTALERDLEWDLGFHVPRADGNHVAVYEREGLPYYVYRRIKARELWDMILKNTYEWAEPGIIFIDRVNNLNNLRYCEYIQATNPCGEQPLPPNGDCNLGHVNLASHVLLPFTDKAAVDWDRLKKTVHIGVRFLDNVLDTSPFPIPAQHEEAIAKRRIGLGYTGLANLFQQLMVRYGSKDSIDLTRQVGRFIANEAYRASALLAKERGTFPMYDKEAMLAAPFIQKLDADVIALIEEYGLRNGVLLSLAPVGTGSIYSGNTSSGLEPSFSFTYGRDVVVEQKGDEQIKEFFTVEDYGYCLYRQHHFGADPVPEDHKLPSYMVTALELPVEEHIYIAGAAQEWIDAAISKTINCPKEMTFEQFKNVYQMAWDLGLKGCTTFRPSDVRGSVLKVEEEVKAIAKTVEEVQTRPDVLQGTTHKLKWVPSGSTIYLTVNDLINEESGDKRPFEVFLSSKDPENFEFMTALTLAISAVCRRGDASFLFEELQNVHSPQGGAWVGQRYMPSVVALVGKILLDHTRAGKELVNVSIAKGERCTNCGEHSVIRKEGCLTCESCGAGKCG